jgi:hypothetical protein
MERADLIERGYMTIRIHNRPGLRRMAGETG